MRIEEIINRIKIADAKETDEFLDVVMERKRELYPDWEIVYFAHEKSEIDKLEELLRSALKYGQTEMERQDNSK